MIDDRTANFNWPLPHPSNDPELQDVPRLRDALTGIDTALAGLAGDVRDEVSAAITALVGAAPEALDTIAELAARLGEDANQITSIISLLAQKATSAEVAALSEATATNFTQDRARLATLEDKTANLEAYTSEEIAVARILAYSGAR